MVLEGFQGVDCGGLGGEVEEREGGVRLVGEIHVWKEGLEGRAGGRRSGQEEDSACADPKSTKQHVSDYGTVISDREL